MFDHFCDAKRLTMFPVYLQLGFEHIADLEGYDHILFLVALCAVYRYSGWKRILVLVTAFTIGHSITLALSALNLIRFDAKLIELLIPVTILMTALQNVFFRNEKESLWSPSYLLPLTFGLIHGMGFSSFFKSLLGRDANVTLQLFAFNVGVEIGQIVIVFIFMVINYIFIRHLKLPLKYWTLFFSVLAIVLSGYMIWERIR